MGYRGRGKDPERRKRHESSADSAIDPATGVILKIFAHRNPPLDANPAGVRLHVRRSRSDFARRFIGQRLVPTKKPLPQAWFLGEDHEFER
jgi:hypothetical protein